MYVLGVLLVRVLAASVLMSVGPVGLVVLVLLSPLIPIFGFPCVGRVLLSPHLPGCTALELGVSAIMQLGVGRLVLKQLLHINRACRAAGIGGLPSPLTMCSSLSKQDPTSAAGNGGLPSPRTRCPKVYRRVSVNAAGKGGLQALLWSLVFSHRCWVFSLDQVQSATSRFHPALVSVALKSTIPEKYTTCKSGRVGPHS